MFTRPMEPSKATVWKVTSLLARFGFDILEDLFLVVDKEVGTGPKALYLNPTLLNPTTHTISEPRRLAVTSIARRFGVPIVEDDPYGLLPEHAPPAFAALAPELT
jgi:DNA-binding transcriptional MocR family regulator